MKSQTKAQLSPKLAIAIEAIKRGEMVILVDSEDRENEGDLVMAAQFATAEKINFFIREACGLVCLPLEAKKIDQLGLPPMVSENQSTRKTAFTISIEAAEGISTGISAQDRAHTIQVAARPDSTRVDIASPGHIFPLRAAPGGVLERAGHTEGSIELCKLAGLNPAAAICEIINEDGTMARKPDLEKFSKKHNIPIVTIEEIIAYRTLSEEWLQASSEAVFPTRFGMHSNEFKIKSFKNPFTGTEHAAVFTDKRGKLPLVRMHSECLTGDSLGSLRCDCGEQLQASIEQISKDGEGGILIYLKNQEGRGIGLWNKIEAYALQDQGKDTFDANIELGFLPDSRHYHEAAKMLHSLGATRIRLLTNNPKKKEELEALGIEVVEEVSLSLPSNPSNLNYLKTKRERFNHRIDLL
jgi:3,4-dihydroxy 2-butanone 4-phosphate synthase/GTP cyclohydrolase II